MGGGGAWLVGVGSRGCNLREFSDSTDMKQLVAAFIFAGNLRNNVGRQMKSSAERDRFWAIARLNHREAGLEMRV